jgi:NADH-quinone oxidoreductase subunit J
LPQTLFLILASLGVLAALGVVLGRNLVHCALFLVAFFFLVACLFVLLEAEFLAAVQVLVYIGAVAILLMFGIMLTRNIQGDDSTDIRVLARVPAGLVSLGFLAVIVAGTGRHQPWVASKVRPSIVDRNLPRAQAVNNMGKVLGHELMGRFALPFEVAGLLLTAVLVGSIALARQEPDEAEARASGVRRQGRKTTIPRSHEDKMTSSQP